MSGKTKAHKKATCRPGELLTEGLCPNVGRAIRSLSKAIDDEFDLTQLVTRHDIGDRSYQGADPKSIRVEWSVRSGKKKKGEY